MNYNHVKIQKKWIDENNSDPMYSKFKVRSRKYISVQCYILTIIKKVLRSIINPILLFTTNFNDQWSFINLSCISVTIFYGRYYPLHLKKNDLSPVKSDGHLWLLLSQEYSMFLFYIHIFVGKKSFVIYM